MSVEDYLRFEHDQQAHKKRTESAWAPVSRAILIARLTSSLERLTGRSSTSRKSSRRSTRLSAGGRMPTLGSFEVPTLTTETRTTITATERQQQPGGSLAEGQPKEEVVSPEKRAAPACHVGSTRRRSLTNMTLRSLQRLSTLQRFSTRSPAKEPLGQLAPRPVVEQVQFAQFVQLLLTPENSMVDPLKTATLTEKDLSHPVCHYFINCSHNSFLTGHQLYSRSSPDMYRRQLLLGVRSLEIDCWDGPRGQPIVTHGHTLCSSVSFDAVAKAIAETAFITSRCPVVLSLEMVRSPPDSLLRVPRTHV